MASFAADSLYLSYASVELAKQWWMQAFGCKVAQVPSDWDATLPFDVALRFPGSKEPTILLSAKAEVEQASFDRPSPVVSAIFCDKLKKAHDELLSRGISPGPIQDGGDMQFFEIRDLEANLIQICQDR